MVNISVKWGKEKLDVEVDPNENPLVFKGQLFTLTGVAPERQKVVIKVRLLMTYFFTLFFEDFIL